MATPAIKQRIEQFVRKEGRRPRVLVTSMDQKGHGHDTKLLATIFAEAGFDVDISPLHRTPRGTARMAIENDVHLICFLSTKNRHKRLASDLIEQLKTEQAGNIRILVGGAIPRSDYQFLSKAGVDLIFNSMPVERTAIHQVLNLFE